MSVRAATVALLALAAAIAGGCGADEEKGDPIPAAAAADLEKRLDSVQGRFDFGGGACGDIPEDQALANQTIQSLPESVDADVRAALQDGFDRLFQLTDEQCDEQKGQETEPEPLPTETEEQPTETEEQPTETEEEPTETAEPPPTEPGPPEEDPGDGGGAGPPTGDEG